MKTFLFLLCLALFGCAGSEEHMVQTALVKRGTFAEELIEEGSVRAFNATVITSPTISYRYGTPKIIWMIPDGSEVNQGDTLIVFDPSEINKALVTAEQQLEVAYGDREKQIIINQGEIADLEADLEVSRIGYEIAKIRYEQAIYESEVTRKEIGLNLETSRIALERARDQIDTRKKVQQEEIFQRGLSINQMEGQLEEGRKSLDNLSIKSPSPGIAIIKENWSTGQKWNVGDQPYSSGALIDLPDLSTMIADLKISEVDISKIRKGQKVILRPDAYSDSVYTGSVFTIANLAQSRDAQNAVKIFPVQVLIDRQDKKLLPGLTMSCKIIVNEVPDVLYIPLECLFKDDFQEFVYVKTASGFKRRPVKVGAMNLDYALVLEGVEEHEELALTDPFLHTQEDAGSAEKSEEAQPNL